MVEDGSQQRLNSSSSSSERCSVPELLGGHGPWQYRHWLPFFLASACASLHLAAPLTLARAPPHNTSDTALIEQFSANCSSCPSVSTQTGSCEKYLEADFIAGQDDGGCFNVNFIIYSKCVYALGILLSGITIRLLMFRFSRRCVSLASGLILLASALAVAWSRNPATFLILRFVISVAGVNVYLLSAHSLLEVIGEEHRLVYGLMGHFGWCLAHFLVPLVAWPARDWTQFSIAASALPLLLLIALCFVPESIESFLSKGLWSRAEKIIRQAAWSNGCSTQDVEQFTHNFTPRKIQEELKTLPTTTKETFQAYFQLVFLFFVGFSTAFLYFALVGLSEWVRGSWRGTYVALAGTAEVASALVLLLATCFLPLKHLWAACTAASSASLLLMYAKPGKGAKIFSTFPYLLALFFASCAWTILLYRTLFRPIDTTQAKRNAIVTCVAICVGILAAAATDFQKFHDWNPKLYVIYGIPNLTVGASIGFIPDRYFKF